MNLEKKLQLRYAGYDDSSKSLRYKFPVQKNDSRVFRIKIDEERISNRANYVSFSSDFLRKLFHDRYGLNKFFKEDVIRNAFNGQIISPEHVKSNPCFTICYFGTISDWFDFNIILKSLSEFENLKYLFVGPLHRGMRIPDHSRIKHIGTVEHDQLYEVTKDADCYVMPFIMDDSIKAVDPVKLYEYINFGKNIICIQYDEVKRFSEFVFFYNNSDDYNQIIRNLMESNKRKYSEEMRIEFLRTSSWTSRKQQIVHLLSLE